MWNPFSHLLNLYRIQKLVRLFLKFWNDPNVIKDSKYWKDVINTAFSIKEVKVMLQGYKTYIVAALMAAATFVHALGFIDDSTYQTIMAFLASLGAVTIAAKINRTSNGK